MTQDQSAENRKKEGSQRKNYIKVDFKTIQGRITAGFFLMGAFALVILISSNRSWKKQVKEAKELIELNKNSSILASELQQQIDLTTILSFRYINTEDEFYKNDVENRWLNDVYPMVDQLDSLARKFGNEKIITFTDKLGEHLPHIKNKQKEAIANLSYEKLNEAEIIDDIIHLTFLTTKIKEELAIEERKSIQSIEEAESNIPILLSIEFIIAFIISNIIALFIIRSVLMRIKFLKDNIQEMSRGNLPAEMNQSADELNSIIVGLNEFIFNLKGITRFAEEVGKGDFNSEISVFDNQGHLGKSLADMRIKLQNVAEQDKRRVWFNEGIAKFGDILRQNNQSIENLSGRLISELVDYTTSNQGSIFIVDKSDLQNIKIVLKGTYAFNRQKFLEKEISPGQGLVGQCYLEKESIYLTEIPHNYFAIRSGLGEASPTHLLIIPMQLNEEVFGIIELASFHPFQAHCIEFVDKVGESIASTLQALQVSIETKKLLEESQMKAEQLQAQEEEMRQNAEELEATQEEMERQGREIGAFNRAISISTMVIEFDKSGLILKTNNRFELETGLNSKELLGWPKSKVFKSAPGEKEWTKLWNEVMDSLALNMTETITLQNGDSLEVNTHYVPVADESGNTQKLACLCFKK